MFANPIIRRYGFSQLRGQQISIFGSVYAAIALLILFTNISVYRFETGYETLTDLYAGLFVQFAVIEMLLLWLVMPFNTSNVVSREIGDKSFDFFRMLPLSASQKASGILVGRNLLSLVIAMVNLAICVTLGLLGGISTAMVMQMLAVLVAITMALSLIGLLSSIITYRKSKATGMPILIIVGLFAFGPAMGLLAQITHQDGIETATASFFTLEMPVLYLIAFLALCLSVWAYIGILRRFTYEYESLFSRAGARLFVAFSIAVLYGLFFKYHYYDNPRVYPAPFWILSLLPVAMVPACSLYSYDKYLEITRKSGKASGLLRRLAANSNVVLGLSLFAIWLAAALFVGLTSDSDIVVLGQLAVLALSSLLVILALLETYVTWKPKNEKVGYLLGFAVIIYCALPPTLAAIFNGEELVLFSPFGVMIVLDKDFSWPMLLWPVVTNLLWAALLGMFIVRRYRDLVAMRAAMESPQA
jgi:hypothetical protein